MVVEETAFFVPEVFLNISFEHLGFVLKVLYFLPALNVETYLKQLIGSHILLQIGVEPNHVAVAEDGIVVLLHARHVIHARAPAARPVSAVAPCVVQAKPLIVSHKRRECLVKAVDIAKLLIINQFAPRNKVRTGAHRVVAFEAVAAVGMYFAADKAIGVLLGIEIIERALEIEETRSIAREHQDESRVPHENVAIVGSVDIRHHEARAGKRVADVFHTYLPCFPVHVDFGLVTLPDGHGQHLTSLLKTLGQLGGDGFGRAEVVFSHKSLFHIGVFVWNAIDAIVAATLCVAYTDAHSRCECHKYRSKCHFLKFSHSVVICLFFIYFLGR